MGTIVLLTGGARSGKSACALARGNDSNGRPKVFIATAEGMDDEMRTRIQIHQNERGSRWSTVEEPYDLASVIDRLESGGVAIIDCCTVWLGNIWHKLGDTDSVLLDRINSLCDSLSLWREGKHGELYIVSNEVGWGIVPLDPGVRRYRDWVGRLNQRIASIADEVLLCVAGIPITVKTAIQGMNHEAL